MGKNHAETIERINTEKERAMILYNDTIKMAQDQVSWVMYRKARRVY